MRWSAIAGEARRTIVSGTALTLPLLVVLALLSVGAQVVASLELRALVDAAQRYRDAGADILVLTAEGAVDAAACEGIGGALRRAPHDLVAPALPGSGIPTYEVTPGLAHLLAGDVGEGVIPSESVLETVTTVGPSIAGTYAYPDDGRRADLGFAVLIPVASTGMFDECWARAWPESPRLAALLRLADSSGKGEVAQLNASLGSSFAAVPAYRDRATRWLPGALALAALAVGFGAVRLRRVELASARHAGVGLADQWFAVALESLAWAVGVVLVTVPVAAGFVARAAPGDAAPFVLAGAVCSGVTCAAGILGATLGVLTCGERGLFRHVKARR